MDDTKNKLVRIEEKMDEFNEKLHSIDKTLERNTVSLEEHMRRSALNEEAIELLKEEFKPVQKHVTQVHAILQFFGFLGILASIVAGIVKFLEFI
jgi:uncharacterized membrane protein (DUF106 family)